MLSVKEAATMLGVSPARVRKLIADDEIPASKVGSAWVLEESDVLDRLSRRPRAGRPRARARNDEGHAAKSYGAAQGEPDRVKRAKHLFRECQEDFSVIPDASMISAAESAEEAAFYVAVSDFFLQQKQRQLVSRGVF